jgi:ribosomal protein S18 acetylase RimI-like enzyme
MEQPAAPTASASARVATHDDIGDIVHLVGEYWAFEGLEGFDAAEVAEQLDYLLSDRRLGDVWVCGSPPELAGYLVAVYVFSLEHKGLTAAIDEFFVLPALRGRGLGQSLLAAAEARFRELRCTNVSLQLARENDDARLFYRDRGYADRSGFELLDKNLRKPTK